MHRSYDTGVGPQGEICNWLPPPPLPKDPTLTVPVHGSRLRDTWGLRGRAAKGNFGKLEEIAGCPVDFLKKVLSV